jgi:hypothetical protein
MNTQKLIIALFAIGSIGRLAEAQNEVPNAPQWQATLHITDDEGSPVGNAIATAGYYIKPTSGNTEPESHVTGVTDTNGLVILSAHSGPVIWCSANKAGYYSTTGLEFDFTNKAWDQWQPLNPSIGIALDRIVNPIPMYAKSIEKGPPIFNQPVGYDLVVGDWVAPNGRGQTTDIIFTVEYHKKSLQDYDYKLTVSFPNAGDGIQEFKASGGGLRSPYEATENGYEPQLTRLNVSHPGQSLVFDYDKSRNYFIRVRTSLGVNGNVNSALYGKIYGDFMHFTYYLNPTPNSRNVEFDPKQNLLSLQAGEPQIGAP